MNELGYRVNLMGKIVDQHEIGYWENIQGIGNMLQEFAERIHKVQSSLEEGYRLTDLEEDIKKSRDQYQAQVRERVSRLEQRGEIFRKHSAEADREVEEQGLDVSEDPGEGE